MNFALFSANATKVEVCLFDESGERELSRHELPEHTDGVWHGGIPDLKPGSLYNFRVHGPYEPHAGHRFNPNKLVMDPYAKAHHGKLIWDPAVYGYTLGSKDGDLSYDERDSAPFIPKSIVVSPAPIQEFGVPSARRVRWEDTIIFETHVHGFTKLNDALPENLRGTYAGLAQKEVIAYLQALGVTSVELLPIHAFLDDAHLLDRGLKNYWGYNTINFFTPATRYAANQHELVSEFKAMVSGLHEAGIEVLLDVVYNHTAEGNELGATLSYKGIDNASYYRLLPDNPRYYINDTGTGNTLNISHPKVMQMVTDSLRYWVQEMGVDGFRFDLGTILAREPEGFDPRNGFLNAVGQDPILQTVKLIAEPWDCGPGGYQVGGFPAGWAEWNDTFRDITRDFWRGEAPPSALAEKLLGSPAQFFHDGRRTWASVNFVTAHDGFTLNDVVSYNDKHNDANGENNNDGSSTNRSWNCGAEGKTDDPEILALRERQMRNFFATLLLSQGTPMILAGDERANSQDGNNNAYCQDNELSWISWKDTPSKTRLRDFVKRVIGLRQRLAVFHSTRFFRAAYDSDEMQRSVRWYDAGGTELQSEQWDDPHMRSFGMLLDTNIGLEEDESATTIFVALNAYYDVVQFTLPPINGLGSWKMILDTNIPDDGESAPVFEPGKTYGVTGRSMVVFERQ